MEPQKHTSETTNNNTGVPAYIHITTTLIVIFVFSVALQQACSLSIKHELFKIRIGVLLSNAILCVLSIVLNFDLLRNNGDIGFLDGDFVLIVRTFQFLWLFISFFIGYFFVIYSINSAYKSSSYISISSTATSTSKSIATSISASQLLIKKQIPLWMTKFWLFCTIIQESILFLCYIIAFTTTDIVYIHICWVSAFFICIIGAFLVIFALIDIRKYVWNKTKKTQKNKKTNNNHHGINVINLKKLNRLLLTMIILCILIISASIINLINLLKHIVSISSREKRPNTLLSTVIDNITDYISYLLILLSVEISFIAFTYKPSAVNYCIFCCFYHKYRYQLQSFHLDKNTMCYAFCKNCIDNAEQKRRLQLSNTNNNNNIVIVDQHVHVQVQPITTNRYLSITSPAEANNNNNNNNKNAIIVDKKIKIILYDFDGVLTSICDRYFEHWTEIDVNSLSLTHLNNIFGEDERINNLLKHLIFLIENDIKIFCISFETTNKINTIFKKLQFSKYFNAKTIIGCDHKLIKNIHSNSKHSKIKLFILNLIQLQDIDYDELLYISANDENVQHFSNINLCITYKIISHHGLNQNDINNIQSIL